jgi:hypothetical protein
MYELGIERRFIKTVSEDKAKIVKPVIKKILRFCKNTILFIYFLLDLIRQKSFSNPIKKKYSGTVAVLANGPSLKEVLPHLASDDKFKNCDFIAMNFFTFDDVFFKIKPKHYWLADPMFFRENHRIDEVRKLFAILQNNIDWKMNIYIPKVMHRQFMMFSGITNSKITIVKMNTVNYIGYEYLRNFFYRNGLAIPSIASVAILAIYVALNSGYSTIELYGVDHNFFDTLCVNEKGELCSRETHFYDNDNIIVKPMLRSDNSRVWKLSDFLFDKWTLFKSHDLLANYAESIHVNILNCTKQSMIDSYKHN